VQFAKAPGFLKSWQAAICLGLLLVAHLTRLADSKKWATGSSPFWVLIL